MLDRYNDASAAQPIAETLGYIRECMERDSGIWLTSKEARAILGEIDALRAITASLQKEQPDA